MLHVNEAEEITFVNVMEAHGEYNGAREFTVRSASQLTSLRRYADDHNVVIEVETAAGRRMRLAISYDPRPQQTHRIDTPSGPVEWSGFYNFVIE